MASSSNTGKKKGRKVAEGTKCIVLTQLSPIQLAQVLDKLQLNPSPGYTAADCLKLLSCSKIFMNYFTGFNGDNILVMFDKNGKFLDCKSSDNKVPTMFPMSDNGVNIFPCCICAGEITQQDDADDLAFGCECSGCGEWFHNSCCSKPMTRELHDTLRDSPAFVKIFCPKCNLATVRTRTKLAEIEEKCRTLESKLDQIISRPPSAGSGTGDDSGAANITESPWITAGKRGTRQRFPSTSLPTRVVENLAKLAKDSTTNPEEEKARTERTRIIIKPKDNNIIDSKDIRTEFNKHHKGIIIRMCRRTIGGSILLELEDQESAEQVDLHWKDTYFGGNLGLRKPGQVNTCGLIKHVYDFDKDEIEKEILEEFPAAKIDFFNRKGSTEFSGIVKVDFKDKDTLQRAISDKITICNQRYLVEEFKRKPTVIKCNRCQGFSHISSVCRSKKPRCGKCSSEDHETKDCKETTYKCFHCGGQHLTGSVGCKIMKEKLAELVNRNNYDF